MKDRRLLVIAEIGCGPPYMGNRMRMRALLEECRGLGYEIHFAGVKFSGEEKAATMPYVDRWVWGFRGVEELGWWARQWDRVRWRPRWWMRRWLGRWKKGDEAGEENVDRWMAWHWVGEARRLQRRERYERVLVAYVFHAAFLEAFGGGCWKVVDTHDVFGRRRERLEAAGLRDYWFTTSESEERRALARADVVIAIQEKEAAYFRGLLGGVVEVVEVGHFLEVGGERCERKAEERPRVGFLGSDNPLNVDALRWFLGEVWPEVVARIPGVEFLVGGTVCGAVAGGGVAGVVLAGEVGDVGAVAEFYGRCVCSVNPMRIGTGLKIKTVESMAHCCPVVSTPVGAAGLEKFEGRGLVVAEGSGEFVEVLVEWLCAPERASFIGAGGRAAVGEINERWREALAGALGGT
jgi:glycosyltransferase involved in cell wall biosynthesis